MASPLQLRGERGPEAHLPYAAHASEHVVRLDSGALITAFALTGIGHETADTRRLNDLHEKLNAAWRNLARPDVAVWHHVVRRPIELPPRTGFRTAFAAELEQSYARQLAARGLYANDLYLTLVLHPARAAERFGRLGRRHAQTEPAQALARLDDVARDVAAQLCAYGPRRLGLRASGELWFSEPAEMLRLLITGRPEPVPLVRGHLGAALYTVRAIFGREALEVRHPAHTDFAAMLGLKEYPAATRPGLWDALLGAAFPFVMTQAFAFLSKPAAQTALGRKQNQMLSAGDKARSQVGELGQAMDDLVANRFVMGEHHASLLVRGDTPAQVSDRLARARVALGEAGLVTAREDLALEAAFWAQFPGAFRWRARPAAISSRNFAALAPFHGHPAGPEADAHWGPSVAVLRTPAATPFHLHLHQGDLGHTFLCGPSGSGKTVLQTVLLAQLERHGAQRVLIDKDRGAEPFVDACGGRYLALASGRPTGLAPLKALDLTPANQRFLVALLTELVGAGPGLDAPQQAALEAAVAALAPLPPAQRSLAALRVLLGQQDRSGIGARLERWTAGGPLGWALDNPQDDLDLDQPLLGLDITDLLDQPEVRGPVLRYLFHRLAALRDGRRLVIDIDEFWKALDDAAFRDLANDGLKTFRKQNALLILGTQSPADVLRSPIAHTLLEQCATKIYLPNPQASARDYMAGFGLTAREFELVRDELTAQSRRFLIKQAGVSHVAELDLGGLPALDRMARRPEAAAGPPEGSP